MLVSSTELWSLGGTALSLWCGWGSGGRYGGGLSWRWGIRSRRRRRRSGCRRFIQADGRGVVPLFGHDRQRQGGEHEDRRGHGSQLAQERVGATCAEDGLAGSAEGGPDLRSLPGLKEDDADHDEGDQHVEDDQGGEHGLLLCLHGTCDGKDSSKLGGIETSPADERTIHFKDGEQLADVLWSHAPSVEHRHALACLVPPQRREPRSNMPVRLAGLRGRGGLAGPDCPDRVLGGAKLPAPIPVYARLCLPSFRRPHPLSLIARALGPPLGAAREGP